MKKMHFGKSGSTKADVAIEKLLTSQISQNMTGDRFTEST